MKLLDAIIFGSYIEEICETYQPIIDAINYHSYTNVDLRKYISCFENVDISDEDELTETCEEIIMKILKEKKFLPDFVDIDNDFCCMVYNGLKLSDEKIKILRDSVERIKELFNFIIDVND